MTTREQLDNLITRMGLTVTEQDLTSLGVWGLYSRREHLIIINERLTARLKTAALAHELAHAIYEHDGHQTPPVEQQVNEMAARMLISRDAYKRAEALYGCDVHAIANELDVALIMVESFRRVLERENPPRVLQ